MAKTADDILKHWGIDTHRVQCAEAMHEFAAQEVKETEDVLFKRIDTLKQMNKNQYAYVQGLKEAHEQEVKEVSAKEVEAYKERLKIAIGDAVEEQRWTLQHALTLIQLTK